jgi:hypothetical protein
MRRVPPEGWIEFRQSISTSGTQGVTRGKDLPRNVCRIVSRTEKLSQSNAIDESLSFEHVTKKFSALQAPPALRSIELPSYRMFKPTIAKTGGVGPISSNLTLPTAEPFHIELVDVRC